MTATTFPIKTFPITIRDHINAVFYSDLRMVEVSIHDDVIAEIDTLNTFRASADAAVLEHFGPYIGATILLCMVTRKD